MQRSGLLVLAAMIGGLAAPAQAQDGALLRHGLESEVRDSLAQLERAAAPPALTGGALFVVNDFNVSVVSALPMTPAATSFAPYSGALGWGLNLDPGGTRGILGVGSDNAGFLAVYSSGGSTGTAISGNLGVRTFAGDLAEAFPAAATAEPGSVMAIDPTRPGALTLAREPYDRRVAGVVAGARDYQPGITLRGLAEIQGVTVTLSGTTYCLASDVNGPIRAGDLLTTSSVPGHAMRASDLERARGAILGKAMQALQGSRGHVLILASLQ